MAEPGVRGTDEALAKEIGITEKEIAQRKAFLRLTDEDARRLASLDEFARRHVDAIVEEFYGYLLQFEEARPFFRDDANLIESLKRTQKAYFLRLTEGLYDAKYVEDRLRVGKAHERIGLPLELYLGMYSFYLRTVATRLWAELAGQPEKALAIFLSLLKLVFFDMTLAIETYVARREDTIRQQHAAIVELSTPVLVVREGLLMLPIIGTVDSTRARQLTDHLLRATRAHRAAVVVMDVTGVPVVDSAVASHLIETVEAARLMGTAVIVTGIPPEIAQTLAGLGLDLSQLSTMGDLQGGIEAAERMLGYRVVKSPEHGARSERPTV